jgi:hypothetical protein
MVWFGLMNLLTFAVTGSKDILTNWTTTDPVAFCVVVNIHAFICQIFFCVFFATFCHAKGFTFYHIGCRTLLKLSHISPTIFNLCIAKHFSFKASTLSETHYYNFFIVSAYKLIFQLSTSIDRFGLLLKSKFNSFLLIKHMKQKITVFIIF